MLENRSLKLALSTLARSQNKELLADQIVSLETDRQQLSAGLDGQLARVELLQQEKTRLVAEYDVRDRQAKQFSDEVASLKKKLASIAEKADGETGDGEADAKASYGLGTLIGTGLVSLLLGGGGMFLFGRQKEEEFEEESRTDLKFDAVSDESGS